MCVHVKRKRIHLTILWMHNFPVYTTHTSAHHTNNECHKWKKTLVEMIINVLLHCYCHDRISSLNCNEKHLPFPSSSLYTLSSLLLALFLFFPFSFTYGKNTHTHNRNAPNERLSDRQINTFSGCLRLFMLRLRISRSEKQLEWTRANRKKITK